MGWEPEPVPRSSAVELYDFAKFSFWLKSALGGIVNAYSVMILRSETASRACGWDIFFALPLLLLLLAVPDSIHPAYAASPSPSPLETHKLQVSDPALFKQIEAGGGRLIADYGGFRLYETAQIPPQVLANTCAEIRDHYNEITLHAGHLDTRKPGVKALQKARGLFQGRRLHLVQFAGPVQAQWRAELLATGAQIVAYIPENTYLIYGDTSQLSQMQGLAARTPHIQWEGVYLDDYKIHPLAKAVDERGRPRTIG